jgi:NAD-dependent deacetylase
MDPSPVERLRQRIAEAPRVAILTGAGVSAASGIPTFRGAGGLWRKVRAETLATPEAFANDPKLVWEWYDWRRQMIAAASPNPAHHALAAWTRSRVGVTLITQNVDGLHERAGTDQLIRLHGSIWRLRCAVPCAAGRADWHDDTAPLPTLPPRCPHCHGPARPAVVWFGEALETAAMAAAVDAACTCDVFLAVGTSANVYPAAGLLARARDAGAFTAEINLAPTAASAAVDLAIHDRAEDVLPRLL